MTAYCTADELISLMGAATALRVSPDSADLADNALTGKCAAAAVDITGALNLRGYGPSAQSTTAQIIAALDSGQALILALANAMKAGIELFEERATEIDYRYDRIASAHQQFLLLPYYWLKQGALRGAFNSNNAIYPVPTYRPQTRTIAFTGTGTNNLTVSGQYTGNDCTAANLVTIEIELIDASTFHWRKNGGSYGSAAAITGSAQLITDGISITIPAGTHNAADKWTITITLYSTIYTVARFVAAYNPADSSPAIANATINQFLDWWTPTIYGIAPSSLYDPAALTLSGAIKYGEIITQCAAAMALQALAFVETGGRLDQPAYKRIIKAITLANEFRSGKNRLDFAA